MPRRLSLVLAVLSTTTLPLVASERLIQFTTPELAGWKLDETARDDGARVYRRKADKDVVIALRVFWAEGKTPADWLIEETGHERFRGSTDPKIYGEEERGESTWYGHEYRTGLFRKGKPFRVVQHVCAFGPYLFEAWLGGPEEKIPPLRADYDRLRSRLRFGGLGKVDPARFRPTTSEEVEGAWNLLSLDTSGEKSAESPLFYAYQHFVFGRDGDLRHVSHKEPITSGHLGAMLHRPLRLTYQFIDKGHLKVFHVGSSRTESWAVYRVVPSQTVEASSPAESGAQEKTESEAAEAEKARREAESKLDKYLIMVYRGETDRPIVARLLERAS